MNSPFKFLDPYELGDRDAFFGREEETRELFSLVTKNRLTFVYGPSGTGKTSLVQCGLGNRFGGVDWLPLYVRRGEDINVSLRRAVKEAVGPAGPAEAGLHESIQWLYKHYLRPVYLIFDQFEELFILGDEQSEARERLPFYETIADILDAELPCRLLFIMREDYFGHLNQFEKMAPDLYHRKLRVEPMNRENLHRVVTGSCKAYGIRFGDERRDPERILDNLFSKKTAVQMPFVQAYLHLLYGLAVRLQPERNGSPVRFDRAAIEALGPIEDALGVFLKEQEAAILKDLREQKLEPDNDLVRDVLDVFVSEEGTKVPMPYLTGPDGRLQLRGKTAGPLAGLPQHLLDACLHELEQSRILRRTETEMEIAHDTLASHIFQQRSDEKRQMLEIRRRIETGYKEHQDSGGAYHFDRGQLARIEPFLEKMKNTLEPEWLDFLEKSRLDAERKENAEKARVERELRLAEEKLAAEQHLREQDKRARNRQRRLTGMIALVAIGAIAASVYAIGQKQVADRQTIEAQNQKNEAQASLCKAWEDQFARVQLEIAVTERNAATFIKAGETLYAQKTQRELDSLNNLKQELIKNIAACEIKQ